MLSAAAWLAFSLGLVDGRPWQGCSSLCNRLCLCWRGGRGGRRKPFPEHLQFPTPSAASNMKIISLRKVDLPSADLGPRVNHPSSGQGAMPPARMGRLEGPTRTPTQLLSSALLWESDRKRPVAQQEEQKLGSSWVTFFLRRENSECSRKKRSLALGVASVQGLKAGNPICGFKSRSDCRTWAD